MALTREEKRQVLYRCSLFNRLQSDTLTLMAEAMEEEQFGPGEEICEAGEVADCVYVIGEGTLAVFLPGQEGPQGTPVRKMGAGDVLGEYGMITGQRTTTIRAEEPATLLSMDYERFESFLLRYPEALLELLKVAVRRLTQAESKLRNKS